MTVLRNVLTDLVDKKLWPVAVALLAALAAIPFLLGGDEPSEAPLPVAPAAAGAQGPDVVVTPAESTEGRGEDRPANDPFRTRPGVAAADGAPIGTAPATASPDPAATGGTAPAPVAGAGDVAAINIPGLDDIGVVPVDEAETGGDTPDGSPAGTAEPRSANLDSWHVDLRFGKADATTERKDVARLSPLPSAPEPFFTFLGVAADGKTALFLVTSDAQASGEGDCVPTPADCDRVELQEGDTEYFDVATPAGEVVRYQLDLTDLSRSKSSTEAAAHAARVRESDAGRDVLRNAVKTKQVDVSDLAYSTDLGLVVPSGRAAQRRTELFGGFRVDLQFGAPGALVKRYNLARLTPLPSVEEPAFVYLGVLGDGETAIFLNPSEAHASGGEAVCEPSPEECQRVKLGAGQSATFDAPTLDGGTTQYQLDIDGITPLEADSPEAAELSRKRESPAGRIILRRLVHEVGGLVQDLTFSGGKGVVAEGAATAE